MIEFEILTDEELLEFVKKQIAEILGCALKPDITLEWIMFDEGGIFSPVRSALIAIYAFVRGVVGHCEQSLQAALSYCSWLKKLNAGKALIHCFLETEESFQKGYFFPVHQLLFSMAKKLVGLSLFYEEEKGHVDEKMQLLVQTISIWLEKCTPLDSRSCDFEFAGISSYNSPKINLIASALGKNTGQGSVRSGKNHIVSFGPHFYPLGQMEKFGIWRNSSGGFNSFQDVMREKKPFSMQSWAKMVPNDSGLQLSDIWVEMDIQVREERVHIYTRFENFGEETPLSFAFFIQSEKIAIHEKHFSQNSLERFRGKSEPIVCLTGEDRLTVIPSFHSYMQVTALAGGSHFWGSNFLVAYDIDNLQAQYHWEIA